MNRTPFSGCTSFESLDISLSLSMCSTSSDLSRIASRLPFPVSCGI
ncbi:MAG: hypothetical protein FIA99_08455 [Ruminiclostridium sp.]|nr:hypothetical protein [Ruminiclostridium sp.]